MKSKNARLIDNDRLKANALLRARITNLIREFFISGSFLEVDTPLIDLYPSMEPAIRAFKTLYFDGRKECGMFLQSSPEYNMKKLLASGYGDIFQITKSFRNGELTKLHNPEFTILEWYRTACDYTRIMSDVEDMIGYIARGLGLSDEITYLNKKVDLSKPYDKLHVRDAFKLYADIELEDVKKDDYYDILFSKGLKIDSGSVDFETFFYFVFVNEIEPQLGLKRPLFLIDFPVELGSLARRKKMDDRYVERFELYICGLELCNAFSELNDHDEQRERFLREKKKRAEKSLDDYMIDRDFLEFLEHGMPESAGIAFGVDRLIMLFADTDNIDDVILFPFSKMRDFCENV